MAALTKQRNYTMADMRGRNWAFIIYPESTPEDFKETIASWHVPAAVSPLHDRDTWTESDKEEDPTGIEGELKKPHFHVLLMFEGKKSAAQVLELAGQLGVKYVEPVQDKKGYGRYLCHMDDPDKFQYDEAGITWISGGEFDLTKTITTAQAAALVMEIMDVVAEEEITEYYDLMRYAMEHRPEWLVFVFNNASRFEAALRSARHIRKEGKEPRF